MWPGGQWLFAAVFLLMWAGEGIQREQEEMKGSAEEQERAAVSLGKPRGVREEEGMREEGAVQGELELQKELELWCWGVQKNRLEMGKAVEGLVSETKSKSQSGGILKDQKGWEHWVLGERSQESSCSSMG